MMRVKGLTGPQADSVHRIRGLMAPQVAGRRSQVAGRHELSCRCAASGSHGRHRLGTPRLMEKAVARGSWFVVRGSWLVNPRHWTRMGCG